MQIAEEADEAPVFEPRQQYLGVRRLGQGIFRLYRRAIFAAGLEIFAVELELPGMFAREHRVRLRARRDENRVRRQPVFVAGLPLSFRAESLQREAHALDRAVVVHVHRQRREAFGKGDAFFQRLFHLFVVERVRGAVDEAPAVGDGDAAPMLQQFDQARRARLARGKAALVADGTRVGEEFLGDFAFLVVPFVAHRMFADFGGENLEAREEFFHLHQIIGERLGRRVHCGQAAADHHHRQAQLHVGDRIGLGRAGELQRHQEIGGGAHAAREAVGDVEHGGLARTHAQRQMVEAELGRILHRQRAAEAHAAEQGELGAALQQQADDLEKILVPAHGDAVFGDTAETRHHAIGEVLVNIAHFAYGTKRHARAGGADPGQIGRQRFDLEAVDADHRVAVVHQMVREAEARRPHAGDEHAFAACRPGEGPAQVERIPARQQAVDLEAVRQLEHVLERARFGLREY